MTRNLACLILFARPFSNSSPARASVMSGEANTYCTRNLSLQSPWPENSFWACMMTWTSRLLEGSTNPELGRTQYFLGEVVLTLKAIRSLVGLCRESVIGMFLRGSKRNRRSWGEICSCGSGEPILSGRKTKEDRDCFQLHFALQLVQKLASAEHSLRLDQSDEGKLEDAAVSHASECGDTGGAEVSS